MKNLLQKLGHNIMGIVEGFLLAKIFEYLNKHMHKQSLEKLTIYALAKLKLVFTKMSDLCHKGYKILVAQWYSWACSVKSRSCKKQSVKGLIENHKPRQPAWMLAKQGSKFYIALAKILGAYLVFCVVVLYSVGFFILKMDILNLASSYVLTWCMCETVYLFHLLLHRLVLLAPASRSARDVFIDSVQCYFELYWDFALALGLLIVGSLFLLVMLTKLAFGHRKSSNTADKLGAHVILVLLVVLTLVIVVYVVAPLVKAVATQGWAGLINFFWKFLNRLKEGSPYNADSKEQSTCSTDTDSKKQPTDSTDTQQKNATKPNPKYYSPSESHNRTWSEWASGKKTIEKIPLPSYNTREGMHQMGSASAELNTRMEAYGWTLQKRMEEAYKSDDFAEIQKAKGGLDAVKQFSAYDRDRAACQCRTANATVHGAPFPATFSQHSQVAYGKFCKKVGDNAEPIVSEMVKNAMIGGAEAVVKEHMGRLSKINTTSSRPGLGKQSYGSEDHTPTDPRNTNFQF